MKQIVLLVLFVFSSIYLTAQSDLILSYQVTAHSYLHPGYSGYTKTGKLTGFAMRFDKYKSKNWFIDAHFLSGDLSSSIDGRNTFYEMYKIKLSYGRYLFTSSNFDFGLTLSLLDGVISETVFPNNRYVHDVSVPGIKGIIKYKYALNSKFNIINELELELISLHSRNTYSTRPSLKFRFSLPHDKFGIYHSIGLSGPFSQRTNWILIINTAYIQSTDLDIRHFQSGVQFGLKIPLSKNIIEDASN